MGSFSHCQVITYQYPICIPNKPVYCRLARCGLVACLLCSRMPAYMGWWFESHQCHRYLFPHFLFRDLPRSLLSSTPTSEEVTVTASFGGDVKSLVLGDDLPRSLLSSTPTSEEVTVTASFGGDVKPLVLGDLVFISLRLFAGPRKPHTCGKPEREPKFFFLKTSLNWAFCFT